MNLNLQISGAIVMKRYTNNQILLKEYIKQEFEENGSYKDENLYFEFLASQQTVKDYDLSDEEVEAGIMGGGLTGDAMQSIYFLMMF